MVHIIGGQVQQHRSPYRLSIIPELFWGIVNTIVMFFRTLIDPTFKPDPQRAATDYTRRDDGRGPPPGNIRGFKRGGGGPKAPPAGGG